MAIIIIAFLSVAIHHGETILPPYITKTFPHRHMFYKAGDNISLPCQAGGEPQPKISWTHNDTVIQSSQDSLFLLSASDETAGKYRCIAENPHGKALSEVLHLQQALDGLLDDQGAGEQDRHFSVGKSAPLVLPCHGLGTFIPPARYYWIVEKENSTHNIKQSVHNRIMLNQMGTLYFANVELTDAGNYTCYGYSSFFNQTLNGSTSSLTVSDGHEILTQPNITYTFAPSKAISGQSLSFYCFFQGSPTPDISWKKGDTEISSDNRFKLQVSDKSKLTIMSPIREDSGEYTCTANNSQGVATSTFTVQVYNQLKFEKYTQEVPKNQNVSKGHVAYFMCKPSGSATKITWYINGQEINKDLLDRRPRIQILDYQILEISNTCKSCSDGTSDLMVVQCVAENQVSSIYGQGYLYVLEPTHIVKKPKDKILYPDSTVEFQCEATSDSDVKYTWTLNGEAIRPNSRITVDGGSVYVRGGARIPEDDFYLGEYTCIVDDGYTAVDTATAFLHHAGSPDACAILNPSSDNNQFYYPFDAAVIAFLVIGVLVFVIITVVWARKSKTAVDDIQIGLKPVEYVFAKTFSSFANQRSNSSNDMP